MKKNHARTKTVRVALPADLVAELDARIREGWYPGRDLVFEKALKKFLNTHRPDIMERHILDDVENALGVRP